MVEPSKENANTPEILLFAGEASGDAYGALLIDELHKQGGLIRCSGGGGTAMIAAGLHPLYSTERLSVMGLSEVISIIPTLLSIKKHVITYARTHTIACAIFIDYPGFNVPLAKRLKALGIPVLYYISPKVWAYREKRIRKVIRSINHLASIFSFEKELYHRYGFENTTFVGHPIVDVLQQAHALEIETNSNSVGLLPGSRSSEISRLLPPMIAAAKIIKQKHPQLTFWLSCMDQFDDDYYQQYIHQAESDGNADADFKIVFQRGNLHRRIAQSGAILCASGTVNLEIAYLGIPALITYRMAPLTFYLAKKLIRIAHVSPVNIIMKSEVYRELLQDMGSAEHLATELERLLFDADYREQQENALKHFKQALGAPGASARTASLALRIGSIDYTDSADLPPKTQNR